MEGQHQTMRRDPQKKTLFSKENNLKIPNNLKCVLCTGSHRLHTCEQFLNLSERLKVVSSHSLCFNCLHPGHSAAVCRYGSCHNCGRKHHTKLHEYQHTIKPDNVATNNLDQQAEVQSSQTSMNVQQHNREHQVMLVKVRGTENKQYELRAVLGSGSQVNFITRRCANLLRLKPLMSTSNISGIETLSTKSAKIEPHFSHHGLAHIKLVLIYMFCLSLLIIYQRALLTSINSIFQTKSDVNLQTLYFINLDL